MKDPAMSSTPANDREGLDDALVQIPANAKIMEITRELLVELGEDPEREGLARTPQRVARAWEFLVQGYNVELSDLVNDAIFEEKCDEMVAVKHIHFFSLCEHHLLPFYGVCNVAYIPNGKVIGLSKIPRIVDMFARRLQVQERLTSQIAQTLQEVLRPRGVAVVMEAFHMCMMMRGVEKQDSLTTTSEMLGGFKTNPQTRAEFLSLMGMKLMS
jgi:GTP cyclohydrolase I